MKRFIPLVVVFAVGACDALDPVEVTPDLHRGSRAATGGGTIRVLTRNVYVGADVDAVLAAPSAEQIPVLAAQAYASILATDFNERAESLAREIARTRPHLVGLQEISTFRIQSPGDAAFGGTVPAETVTFDYLDILMGALEHYGEQYRVVAIIQDTDVEIPMLTGVSPPSFDDVRLTDHDVILARRDVEVTEAVGQNFTARLTIPFGPASIEVLRGFTAVTATVGRQTIRFVNTHLESGENPLIVPLRAAQASELLSILATETNPVVLVGDLNSRAPEGQVYRTMLDAGFQDAWTESRKGNLDGFTCCHLPTLTNAEENFDHRIDLVLARGSVERPRMRVVRATIVGDEQRNRTASGLWPSDHGGVFAALRFRRDLGAPQF